MDSNEIIEIKNDNQISNNDKLVKEIKNKPTNIKKKFKFTKKNKIIIIISICIILLVTLFIAIYFLIMKNNSDKKKPTEEQIIIKKDNYRFENGKLIFINKSDKDIGSYLCENNDASKCKLMTFDYSLDSFDRVLSVYENGKELETSSQVYNDKYVFIADGNKSFIYDFVEKKNILNISLVKNYNTEKELFVVETEDGKYGLIQFNEEEMEYIIRPSYDFLAIVNTKNTLLIAKDKDESYIIDSTGKKKSKNILCNIANLNDKYITCNNNSIYSLYTYDYDELLSDYDYIYINDDEIIGTVKSNRLYLFDNKLNKLNEDGIRLDNKDYIKKYIYSNDNKLLEAKKSFEISLNNGIVTIKSGETTKTINIYEGLISSKLDYINYFDGKIYFYGDAEKIDLIGTYSCSNKNNITSEKSDLTNCSVLKQKDLYSGIYNNDYVFIKDLFNKDEDKYILYSLKENKTKGTYSNITFVNNNELNNNIKALYTSESYFILKSETGQNKGNYGIIEINSSKVTGKVDFKYRSINKDKSYYLLQNIDDKFIIYDTNFNRKSNELDYIKLYDDYYVGIINNKLNVYSYGNAIGILENDLDISNTEYEISFENGFAIKIGDNNYNFNVDGKLRSDENNEE